MEVFVVIPYIERGRAPLSFHFSRACRALQGHPQVERYLLEEVFESYKGIKPCSACENEPRYASG